MEMTVEYTVDLDHKVWVPVPLGFPWNGYADPAAWAGDLSRGLMEGMNAPEEVRQALETTALAMASIESPLSGAIERFWHLPEFGGPERLVHLYATASEARTAEQLAELARAGVGGRVQTIDVLEETAFDVAVRAVVVTEVPDATIAVLRCVGVAGGGVFIIELIEQYSDSLVELEPVVESLFRSIRLRVDGVERVGRASAVSS